MALAVVVVALVVLAEVGGRLTVQRVAARELRAAGVAEHVEVVVGEAWWKPSVVPALLGADLDRAVVRLRDAQMYPLEVSRADYGLHGVAVDLSLRARTVEVTGLDRGTVELVVDPAAMGEDLGVTATVEDDRLLVGADRAPSELAVDGSDLVVTSEAFSEEGGSTRLSILDPTVLPCRPSVRVAGGVVTLRCSTHELPGIIGQHLGPRPEVDPDAPAPPVELEPPITAELDGEGGG